MADNFFKISKGLNLDGRASAPANPESGDIYYNSTNDTFNVYDGSAWRVITLNDAVQVLINKDIDSDNNTITNIVNANIKATAAIAYSKLNLTGAILDADLAGSINASKIADGSVSNTEFQYISTVTSNVQTQLDAKLDDSQLIDDDTMASATSSNIPSAESIKAYTDNLDSQNAKTADNETITGVYTFDEAIGTKHVTTPSNPSAGYMKIYTKSDNKLYTLTSGGVETDVAAGAGTASATVQGLVTSYSPTVQSSVNSVSANYTVLDDDGYHTILVTTSTTDRTITLPTAADNDGRVLTIKKVDSGSGKVTIDGEGSETIDGVTTVEFAFQYDFLTLACDGSGWNIIAGAESASVDVSSSGSFNASQPTLRLRRSGKKVDITVPPLSHTSSSSPITATGVIPTRYLPPSASLRNIPFNNGSSAVLMYNITTSGEFQIFYTNWSGTGVAQTTSQVAGNIGYLVN